MCGIAGIIDCGTGFGREEITRIALAMRDEMVHRGPDDAGVWVDDANVCALAHRRLSIIDLSPDGRQPMGNESGEVQVTFNGEIYNFEELRNGLQAKGHHFRSHSDTEILPHLFEYMDPTAVRQLDGMFSFGVWHSRLHKLLLARDPFGKKPLYYAKGNGWFAFASELHALRHVPGFDARVDSEALALYLLLQYVPHPWTIYRGARKLAPGSYLLLDPRRPVVAAAEGQNYFRFEAQDRIGQKRSFEQRVSELGELVKRAVSKRLVSDVPLGAFLSGGVDSSLVVATAVRELGRPLQTFSIGFEGTQETEHQFARDVARLLGTDHHEEIVKPDAVALVHDVAGRLDEPNGDSSCLPTLLLSRHARRFVTVALSGDGGDELFGGYSRYAATLAEAGDWRMRVARSLRSKRWFSPADAYLSPRWLTSQPEQVSRLMGGLPAEVETLLSRWRTLLNRPSRSLLHRMRTLDVATYLPGAVLSKVDRMSMQVSLEVRSPLLDRDIAEFASGLATDDCWRPPDVTKRILKALTKRYLPESLVDRKKMGFGLPANTWSKEEVLQLAGDALLAPASQLGSLLDRPSLRQWYQAQRQTSGFSIYQVWPFLVLELWLQRACEPARSEVDVAPAPISANGFIYEKSSLAE